MTPPKPTPHANWHYGMPKRVANFMISSMKCQLNESLGYIFDGFAVSVSPILFKSKYLVSTQ